MLPIIYSLVNGEKMDSPLTIYIPFTVADPGVNLTGALHSSFGVVVVAGVVSMEVGFMR